MSKFGTDDRYSFIDDDLTTWHAKIDDDFKPEKNVFIENKFYHEFDQKLSFETITNLVSRSSSLRLWYADAISEYILEVDVPQYFQELIEPGEYQKLSEKVKQYNAYNVEKAKRLNAVAEKAKKDVNDIEKEFEPKFAKIKADPKVLVLTLNSEKLPLGLQLKLENYTPSEASDPRTTSLYSREMLVRYKIELLKVIKDGGDVAQVIDDNCAKF